MTSLKVGDKAPDFTLPADGDSEVSLSSFKGQKVVVYFYPKDDTPGCTTEACDFRDNMKRLEQSGIKIIGISKDTAQKHDKFKTKHDLNFTLASDAQDQICEAYGTWTEKNMYGRKYMGIERSTFLIDETGTITHIWRKVKVPGHVDEVIKTATN